MIANQDLDFGIGNLRISAPSTMTGRLIKRREIIDMHTVFMSLALPASVDAPIGVSRDCPDAGSQSANMPFVQFYFDTTTRRLNIPAVLDTLKRTTPPPGKTHHS